LLGASSLPPIELIISIFSIAFLYASIGFGGASGYLAAMSLFAFSPPIMASTALMLNLFVSSIAFIAYFRVGHFNPRLLWSFLLTSIPAAFLGGYLHFGADIYLNLLYLSLTYVAVRILFFNNSKIEQGEGLRSLPLVVGLICGAGIGLLSGIIGIGGGIFLSPLIVIAGWGTSKQAAASAAGFVFINSLSGLVGRLTGGNLEIGVLGLVLIPIGLLGGWAGSFLGARHLSGTAVRRLLGVVLMIAVARYWLSFL